jgi:cell division septal protein FtsQ
MPSGVETKAEDRTPPAPQRLVEFVNTRRADGDVIGTPEQLTAWLRAYDLVPRGVTATADERDRAARFREGLRALLADNNAEPVASPRPDGLDPTAAPT